MAGCGNFKKQIGELETEKSYIDGRSRVIWFSYTFFFQDYELRTHLINTTDLIIF